MLSTLSTIRLKINERTHEAKRARWRQISDALDGVQTTIHVGNLYPASRGYRSFHPDLLQKEGWEREVRRFNCTLDAISLESTLNFNPEDVHSLNMLSFPTDQHSYREITTRKVL
ncbi:uncharacterized protein DFL_005470 [Arthrobotrys flagrans]|uniref:Uncharacterized protein n=1 Tax=Arthrobotrys flagrans TaxID=97331 RepID=A0A436ZXI8_ARTFL|nr:hypothetical protein DFL_005470 [Arthrobotrys flagrans]